MTTLAFLRLGLEIESMSDQIVERVDILNDLSGARTEGRARA